MIDYHTFEEEVFNWLYKKYIDNDEYTFTVRKNATKGAERDFFVGSESSKYFGTSFWNIPLKLDQNKANFIALLFSINPKKEVFEYRFECKVLKEVDDIQYKIALQLLYNLKEPIKELFNPIYESKSTSKTEAYSFGYTSSKTIEELMSKLDLAIDVLLPIVDEEIKTVKDINPEFIASRVGKSEFNVSILAMEQRRKEKIIEPQEANQKIKKDNEVTMKSSLNQILFGPPGTGKTYNSINKALEVINVDISGKSRVEIKNLYEQKVNEGQIVFTTFHQNMSYEDFIEGIKPALDGQDSSENIGYEIVPGIFKALCTKAKGSDYVGAEEAYDKLIEELNSYPEDQFLDLVTNSGKTFGVRSNSRNSVSLFTGPEKRKSGSLTKAGVLRQLSGESYYKWWISYYDALIQLLKNKYGLSNVSVKTSKPYILIIDEINRGNVSQIFGELITLIEKDKRLGMDEALTVVLPYSKTNFGVPPNLYIIGTMNTADRSVEALDTALRRRFDFTEMPPQPELIEQSDLLTKELGSIKLQDILIVINERIEILLDKDHLIGHSFFMNLKNLEELKLAFQNNIIPLLQEYFYGDYGKIGLVLGNAFCLLKENVNKIVFPNVKGYETPDYSDKQIFKLINFEGRDSNVKFINALKFLLSPGSEVE